MSPCLLEATRIKNLFDYISETFFNDSLNFNLIFLLSFGLAVVFYPHSTIVTTWRENIIAWQRDTNGHLQSMENLKLLYETFLQLIFMAFPVHCWIRLEFKIWCSAPCIKTPPVPKGKKRQIPYSCLLSIEQHTQKTTKSSTRTNIVNSP